MTAFGVSPRFHKGIPPQPVVPRERVDPVYRAELEARQRQAPAPIARPAKTPRDPAPLPSAHIARRAFAMTMAQLGPWPTPAEMRVLATEIGTRLAPRRRHWQRRRARHS